LDSCWNSCPELIILELLLELLLELQDDRVLWILAGWFSTVSSRWTMWYSEISQDSFDPLRMSTVRARETIEYCAFSLDDLVQWVLARRFSTVRSRRPNLTPYEWVQWDLARRLWHPTNEYSEFSLDDRV